MEPPNPTPADANPDYTPSDDERVILDFLAQERRANPWMLRRRTGWRGQDINDDLNELVAARWVIKPRVYDREDGEWTPAYAMYEYNADEVYDPSPVEVGFPDDHDWDTFTVAGVREIVDRTDDPSALWEYRERERAAYNRKTALEAIDRALRALGEQLPAESPVVSDPPPESPAP